MPTLQIDSTLTAYNNYKRDRWRAFATTSIALIVIGILLGLDVWTWVRMAQRMSLNAGELGKYHNLFSN